MLAATGEAVPWSSVIGTVSPIGNPHYRGADRRYCVTGDEHSMRRTEYGHAVCRDCGVGVVFQEERPVLVLAPRIFAHQFGPRECVKCEREFEPRKPRWNTCPSCYEYKPPPTGNQSAYIGVLSGLLGIEVPTYESRADAARVIDELTILLHADPEVGTCAHGGCRFFVDLRRQRYCFRHRVCKGTKRNGDACRAISVSGSDYCQWHQPEAAS